MKRIAVACALGLGSICAHAYEVDTHASISSNAYNRSVAATPALATRLGLDRFDDPTPFRVPDYVTYVGTRDAYLDFTQTDWNGAFSLIRRRPILDYDWRNMYSMPGEDLRATGADRARMKAWLLRGAVREDDLELTEYDEQPTPDDDPYGGITRVFHHFYDPVLDRGLSVLLSCSAFATGTGDCKRSPEWAFGAPGIVTSGTLAADPNRRNHFTWADAREAMWCALTRNAGNTITNAAQNAADRRLCWATTFKSLGHVLHLLQDVAQPQHVRNDRHNPPHGWRVYPVSTLPTRRTYEIWINYRALIGQVNQEISSPASEQVYFQSLFNTVAATPLNTNTTYPIPTFPLPVHYFTTRLVETGNDAGTLRTRRGLADFTNRTFYSEGTRSEPSYPLPDPAQLQPQDPIIAGDPLVGQLTEAVLAGELVDPLKGSYVDTVLMFSQGRVPLLTQSLWQDFDEGGALAVGQISLDQYAVHSDVLIPRAIAYSAGVIDYFFRGTLEVSAPLDGLFSVIDHGVPHTTSMPGYPIRTSDGNVFGFTKLRLRVRNSTPQLNESGTMTPIPRDLQSPVTPGGSGVPTMLAIARYHRNPCYQADLSGDRRVDFNGAVSEPSCAAGTRTAFQEISVSQAVAGNAAMLNGAGQDLAFDFSQQPIPVNATDVVVQVVYRGSLGLETDAIAVGAIDIREPSYVTFWNNTDYAGCFGNWQYYLSLPPGCITEGFGALRAVFTTRICIGTQQVFTHLQDPHGNLQLGDYVRLAALLDGNVKATRSRSIVDGLMDTQIRNRTILGQVRQSSKEAFASATYVSEPFWLKRGFVGSFRPLPFYQINGADPQPVSDSGTFDIGGLTEPITPAAAPDPGTINFPDSAASNMACTMAASQAFFPDEMAHEAALRK